MANLFVLNVAGIGLIAPWAADKNANRLIAIAVERLAGEGGAPVVAAVSYTHLTLPTICSV